jgi:hypothetical protein
VVDAREDLICRATLRATVVYHLTLIVRGEAEELCGLERATSGINLHDWQWTDTVMPNILIIWWILTNKNSPEAEFQQAVIPPIFSPERAIKLQQFEWSLVQNNTSAPKKDSPMWTKAYNQSGFANAEKRLFGTGNYEFWNHPRHFGQPPNMVYG